MPRFWMLLFWLILTTGSTERRWQWLGMRSTRLSSTVSYCIIISCWTTSSYHIIQPYHIFREGCGWVKDHTFPLNFLCTLPLPLLAGIIGDDISYISWSLPLVLTLWWRFYAVIRWLWQRVNPTSLSPLLMRTIITTLWANYDYVVNMRMTTTIWWWSTS